MAPTDKSDTTEATGHVQDGTASGDFVDTEAPKPKVYTKQGACEVCGTPITITYGKRGRKQMYCGMSCKQTAYYVRRVRRDAVDLLRAQGHKVDE